MEKLAHLKSNAMSAPFLAAFAEQATLQANYKEPAGAQQVDVTPSEQKGHLMIIK